MSFKKTASTLVIGTVLGFTVFQGIEVCKNIKSEANFKETQKNMSESNVKLEIVAEKLKSKMNEYAAYKVSESTAPIKCFNQYQEGVKYAKNIFTGEILKNPFSKDKDWVTCEPTVWTYASVQSNFAHEIEFLNSNVSVSDKKIEVEVNYPYLDKNSISIDMNTYKELEPEEVEEGVVYKNGMNGDANLLDMKHNVDMNNNSIKTNARTAWQVKCLEVAPDEINKIYNTDEVRKAELEANTIASVETLLNILLVDTLKELDVVDEDVELVVSLKNN